MKKFENLGRMLSKTEQTKIKGGNPPEEGGPACKTSATTCTFLTPGGNVYTGNCGSTTDGPMGSTVCGCKWQGTVIADSTCNMAA